MRPRVGVSACLLGERVRHDGDHKRADDVLAHLSGRVAWVPVCPERELGLGVPRVPIRLEADPAGGAPRLVTVSTRRDLTAAMAGYAEARVAGLAALGLAGYVLKSRSPSCGREGVPVWGVPGDAPTASAAGAFARVLNERLPGLVVVEEQQLGDAAAREAFLAALTPSPDPTPSSSRGIAPA